MKKQMNLFGLRDELAQIQTKKKEFFCKLQYQIGQFKKS